MIFKILKTTFLIKVYIPLNCGWFTVQLRLGLNLKQQRLQYTHYLIYLTLSDTSVVLFDGVTDSVRPDKRNVIINSVSGLTVRREKSWSDNSWLV